MANEFRKLTTKNNFFDVRRNFLDERVGKIITVLKENIVTDSLEVEFKFKECGYKTDNKVPTVDKTWRVFNSETERWGGTPDTHAWFYGEVSVPKSWKGGRVELSIITGKEGEWDGTNPQFIAYIDGNITQGMDTNHTTLVVDGDCKVHLYAYVGMHSDKLDFKAKLIHIDTETEKLYYHLKVPSEAMKFMDPHEKEHMRMLACLNDAINFIDFRNPRSEEYKKSVRETIKFLEKEFYPKHCAGSDVATICIGHTHIDIAWQWTVQQTREKVLRSFSTIISLMKRFPEFRFMSSQALLYKMVKEDAPELYEQIKEMIRAGRWEVEGAMWVEADCNLSSGESLVRQILFGKRFFQQEFGVDCKVLWLPDVFGYAAALPQILQKSGVDKFVTSKISWNEMNQMPNDVFMWRGIDGTEIFTYFITGQDKFLDEKPYTFSTYVGDSTPGYTAGTWDRFQNKDLTNEVINTYGYGDGGGGPTVEMVELIRRQENGIAGYPAAKIDSATNFLNRLYKKLKNNPRLPKWVGELYLELHRGTYTTLAKNKRNNRKCEFLYQGIEWLSAMDMVLNSGKYPQDEINDGWEIILLNQFHDIIPGSSIKEVYDVSDIEYAAIQKTANKICDEKYKNIAKNIKTDGGVAVFNPHSFANSSVVDINGKKVYVENVPAKGYKVVSGDVLASNVKIGDNTLENKFFKVKFDKNFNIASIYDKKNKREVVASGQRANVLQCFEDYPRNQWDAWDISDYFPEKMWEANDVVDVSPIDEGARAGFAIKRKFNKSIIEQKIYLYNDIPKIDFDTNVDWRERHMLLKAAFPVDINSDKATYDIQFGTVERTTHNNTSWDVAQFEVCAHKFADLSDGGYGVSLMNDCKYGYDIKGNVMRLSLLRAPTWPDPEADQGSHSFTYSLYPHDGDFAQADTIKLSYDLNQAMTAIPVKKQNGTLPSEYSFLSVDCDNIIAETVKKAEDSDDVVVRLFESRNRKTKATIKFGFDVKEVALCDMMENEVKQMKVKDNCITIDAHGFEIVTLKVKSV